MADKTELFTESVSAGRRRYFFDVKESSDGTKYLVISETRLVESEHVQSRVMVFQEHLEAFDEAYRKVIAFWGMRTKTYRVNEKRLIHPNAYARWTSEEDQRLKDEFSKGFSLVDLAQIFQRQESAIRSRLVKLALLR